MIYSGENLKLKNNMLKEKNILLAVTGGIAAYKASYIIREFVKKGANVKVLMTEASTKFITPITLSTLSKNPVIKDFIKNQNTGEWNNHVALGEWADIMLIAPATANTISKMTTGHADSFLLATFLSAKCPVFVAPAMDLDMYKHKSTTDNLTKLTHRKINIIEPESGELASGLFGEGRLCEPNIIVNKIEEFLLKKAPLKNKNVLISAGPTYEAIDPVRFIGNHSSGKMGFALAKRASELGANVTLISGPVNLNSSKEINRIDVVSTMEMFSEIKKYYDNSHIVIMAAAVSDYTVNTPKSQKLKKQDETINLELIKTIDILNNLGENKKNQLLIGFALETENEQQNAIAKLKKKNLDAIVLNSLNDKGAGFSTDTNKISIISKSNKIINFELKNKIQVADDILKFVIDLETI